MTNVMERENTFQWTIKVNFAFNMRVAGSKTNVMDKGHKSGQMAAFTQVPSLMIAFKVMAR